MVATGAAEHVSDSCRIKCLTKLFELITNHILLIDDQSLILSEYKGAIGSAPDETFGRSFLTHIFDNIAVPSRVQQIRISPTMANVASFAEFPSDKALEKFDADDRKFVAVSISDKNQSTILQGADVVEWSNHESAFKKAWRQDRVFVRKIA